MTARKHDASTRFWNLVQKYESVAPDTGDPDWNDPSSVLLRLPLSCSIVPGNPLDDAIALAFAKTAFDVRDPLQWKILLGLFCIAHFAQLAETCSAQGLDTGTIRETRQRRC